MACAVPFGFKENVFGALSGYWAKIPQQIFLIFRPPSYVIRGLEHANQPHIPNRLHRELGHLGETAHAKLPLGMIRILIGCRLWLHGVPWGAVLVSASLTNHLVKPQLAMNRHHINL